MNKDTINELKELLDTVANSFTKQEAQEPLARLKSLAFDVRETIDCVMYEKLLETIDFAHDASGRVRNKEGLRDAMNSSWYVFSRRVEVSEGVE